MHVVFIPGSIAALAVSMFGAPNVDVAVPPKIFGPGLGCEHAETAF